MKKRSKAMLLSAALVMLMVLTACSSVFDAAIGGKVVDADNTDNGIEGVSVFAYDSESARAAAAERWDGKSDVFIDSSVPSTRTDVQGNFSIPTVRWESGNPAYGKDADAKPVYLLFFHKDYELNADSAPVLVQSDKSNTVGYSIEMKKNSTTRTVNINFRNTDAGNALIADTSSFSFDYSYNDGYGVRNVTDQRVTSGVASLSISYRNDVKYTYHDETEQNAPELAISNIVYSSDYSLENTDVRYISLEKSVSSDTDIYFDQRSMTITVNLRDGSSSSSSSNLITTPIQVIYTDPASGTDKKVTVTGGSFTIPVQFNSGENEKTVTLKSFNTSTDFNGAANEWWYLTTDANNGTVISENAGNITITAKPGDDITQSVYFKPHKAVFSGLSGYLISVQGENNLGQVSDFGRTISLYVDSSEDALGATVVTGSTQRGNSQNSVTDYGTFSGLGATGEIVYKYDGSSYKSKDITLSFKYKDIGSNDEVPATQYILINNKTTSSELSGVVIHTNDYHTTAAASRAVMSTANVLDLRGE